MTLTDMQIDKLLNDLDNVALNFGDDLPGLALNSRGLERSREVVRAALAGQQDEPDCPNCQGSGEVMVMTSHLGPDDYEYPAPCDHCDGAATLEAAYLGVVKLLEKERAESLKLSGKLYGLRHSQERRDAFLLELGEDLARWKDPIGYWKDKLARQAKDHAVPQLVEALTACHDALVRIREAGGSRTSAEIVAERALSKVQPAA